MPRRVRELLPDGGFEYSGFDWAGNESPFYVHRVSFPEVAVPRTERTAVFRPHAMGEVFRPDWRKFKPRKTVSTTAADYLAFNCIATMDDGACSHFLDMRGEARRVSPTAFYVRNGERRGKVVVQKALPTVLHSEWRARDGREAAVLANWTTESQTYQLDFGGGKTVSGTLAAREWRLEELAPCVAREKSCSGCFPKNCDCRYLFLFRFGYFQVI